MVTGSHRGGARGRNAFDEHRLARVGAVGQRYVERGALAGVSVAVVDSDGSFYVDTCGDAQPGAPVSTDTVFRIYSMTKPLTSLLVMQLYEEGEFLLEDPIASFLPAFADMTVWAGGNDQAPVVRPAATPITIKHLLTHTAGLTYGFVRQHPLDALYRGYGLGDLSQNDTDLAGQVEQLGSLPLLAEPGTRFAYSMATDVLGALVEVVTGQDLASALQERILEPLAMTHTGFQVSESDGDKLAALYLATAQGPALIEDPASSPFRSPPSALSGGGGLVSTLGDYGRFVQCLLRGGELDGARIIGSRTLAYMTMNHLPGGCVLNDFGQTLFSEVSMEGTGFGLGFSVVVDPAAVGTVCSAGEFAWGGLASTAFWVDPTLDVALVFMTQLIPSSAFPLRRQLRAALYGAIVS